jgi:hypothetical protein
MYLYTKGVIGLYLIFRIHACSLMISLELISWSTISISTEIVMNEKNLKVYIYLLPSLVTYYVVPSTSSTIFRSVFFHNLFLWYTVQYVSFESFV